MGKELLFGRMKDEWDERSEKRELRSERETAAEPRWGDGFRRGKEVLFGRMKDEWDERSEKRELRSERETAAEPRWGDGFRTGKEPLFALLISSKLDRPAGCLHPLGPRGSPPLSSGGDRRPTATFRSGRSQRRGGFRRNGKFF
jgi:hypothetical protein